MAIVDWLEANIDSKILYTGNQKEVHFNCPNCNETRHRMYVSLNTGAVYCHNCNYKGSIVNLIQLVEGVSFSRASTIFNDVKGNLILPENISRDFVTDMFSEDLRKDLKKRAIPLPEEYTPLNPKKLNIRTRQAVNYLHTRGITDEQITAHKMGYCYEGQYKNRVIIPITENGELKFWVARAISKTEKLKEKSPSNEDYQISKSEVVFNLDRASKLYHSAVLCEGIFDALSYDSIGVSLLGKSLYKEQLNILLDYRNLLTNGVFISLDNDASESATKIAKQLSEYFKVYIINIPRELDDPNNTLQKMGRGYLFNLLANAEEYSELSIVKRILR